jgi:rod shape-determining protein MreC
MSPIIKKKGEKFTIPSKYLLLILTILCCILMVITFTTNLFRGPLNALAGYIVVPFQEGITNVAGWMGDRTDELEQLREVLKINQELQDKVDALTIENTKLQQEKYELNYLRELFELYDNYEQYEKTGARVIARESGNWYHSFTINKGYDDGLRLDNNVLAGGGLVGRITNIGPNWASVTSIIDDDANVSGMILATSDNLIVSGNLQLMSTGNIRFQQLVDSSNKVVAGDKVVTSMISDKYLPGILIGYISSIEKDSNNLTKSGYLTPVVDFEHVEEVLVILENKEIGGE